MANIFERLKGVLEEEVFRMEKKVARRSGFSSLRAYESGIAIVESKLPVEIGDLVGIYRESGKVDPIGFVVDSKLNKYVINTITAEYIQKTFRIAEAEYLYSLRERIKILNRAGSIISRFSLAEKKDYTFLDESQLYLPLDEYERKAAEASLSLNDGEILLVMGPPGTGKTQFITEASRILAEKERVFVTSQVHQAIDNMFERLPPIDYAIRIGSHHKISEGAKEFSLEYKYLNWVPEHLNDSELAKEYAKRFNSIKEKQRELLSNNNFLVGATVTKSITEPLKGKEFDTVFIDEAHNLCLSSALFVLERAKKAVIVGDYWQLPPIYTTPSISLDERAEFSTFTFFYKKLIDRNPERLIWLKTHYRCNENIITFSARHIYGEQFIVSEKCRNEKLKLAYSNFSWLNPEKPFVFFDVSGSENVDEKNSVFNDTEAQYVAWITKNLVSSEITPNNMVVLTPFTAQTKKIKEELKNKNLSQIPVRTVHKYIGAEKDIVIFSIAATSPSHLKFIDKRLTNVFVTRARKKLIIIGSSKAILNSQNITLMHLYNYALELHKQGKGLIMRL